MADYDVYYRTEDLFGAPFKELIAFFERQEPKGSIADLGCGQGRNAIPLAGIGYKVTGIDTSGLGVEQMVSKAKAQGLEVTGEIGDIYQFNRFRDFDIVLFDSMFHFGKRDKDRETGLIERTVTRMKQNGVICFCIQDTGKKVGILKDALHRSGVDFSILADSPMVYHFADQKSGHRSETQYRLLVLKKTGMNTSLPGVL